MTRRTIRTNGEADSEWRLMSPSYLGFLLPSIMMVMMIFVTVGLDLGFQFGHINVFGCLLLVGSRVWLFGRNALRHGFFGLLDDFLSHLDVIVFMIVLVRVIGPCLPSICSSAMLVSCEPAFKRTFEEIVQFLQLLFFALLRFHNLHISECKHVQGVETYLLPLSPFFVVEGHCIQGRLDEILIDILADEDDWRSASIDYSLRRTHALDVLNGQHQPLGQYYRTHDHPKYP